MFPELLEMLEGETCNNCGALLVGAQMDYSTIRFVGWPIVRLRCERCGMKYALKMDWEEDMGESEALRHQMSVDYAFYLAERKARGLPALTR